MEGTKSVIRDNFHNLLTKLMKSLGAVYPESTELLAASVFLSSLDDDAEKAGIMKEFYEATKDHMDELQDRDVAVVRQIVAETPLLRRLGLVDIVNDPEFEQSLDPFFQYLDNLVSMCRMTYEVSERMMQAIEAVGHDVAARVRGGYTPTSAADVEALGQAVVEKLGEQTDSRFVLEETNKLLDILTSNNEFETLITKHMAGAAVDGSS